MISATLTRTKDIRDPLFGCIKAFSIKHLTFVKVNGTEEEYTLAKQRYDNLKPSDVQIENPVDFSPISVRACFLSRTRGFFHADAVIEKSTFTSVMRDFEMEIPQFKFEDLITEIEDKRIKSGLFVYPDGQYVMVMNSTANTVEDAHTVLGSLAWDKMTLTIDPAMDPATKVAGSCNIESVAIPNNSIPVLYADYIVAAKG